MARGMRLMHLVRFCLPLFLGLLATSALPLLMTPVSARAAGAGASSAASTDWTVALYANGDNDLYYTWGRFTLPALQRIPASPDLNVVAMLDRPKYDGTWLYQVSGPSVITVKHYAERDFGSSATFRWFLEEVHARFPSEHLLVVCWDHGYGWRYFSNDFTSDDRITMPELRRALAGAGVPIDILAFDACNMADVEVAWDVASVGDPAVAGEPLVDYLVGSEETIDQDGYPYGGMLTPLAADPSRSPLQVTQDMVRGWSTSYDSLRCFDWVSLSAVDLAQVREAGADLADFAGRLRAGLRSDPKTYGRACRRALAGSIYAWDSWQVDLAAFAGRLAADGRLSADTGLIAAAAAVRDDVRDRMVVDVASGSYARWFEGLTVWAGTGSDWTRSRKAYARQSLFGAGTADGGVGWLAVLRAYNASRQADPRKPDLQVGRATYGLTDVSFQDARRGWATGYSNVSNNAVLLRTRDGGETWTTTSPASWYAYMLSSLSAWPGSPDAGRPVRWAVGSEGWEGSLILRSGDGGKTWQSRKLRDGTTKEYLLGVEQPDGKSAWICGTRGTLLRWRSGRGIEAVRNVPTAPAGDLFGLEFQDAERGWVLANDVAGVSGSVLRTEDSGGAWTAQVTTPGSLLYAIDSVGQDVWVAGGDPAAGGLLAGEAVSGNGIILHSPDGGATWEAQLSGSSQVRISDIDMLNADEGWAVGDGTAVQRSLILHTDDGGAHWTVQDPGVVYEDLAAVHALSSTTAWAVGDGEDILKTTDGGASWYAQRGDVVGPWTRVKSLVVRQGGVGIVNYWFGDAESADARVTLRVRDDRNHLVRSWDLGWRPCSGVVHHFFFNCLLPRGTYTVRAEAVDRAGNRQSSARSGTLIVR